MDKPIALSADIFNQDSENKNFLIVSFEDISMNTYSELDRISSFLGRPYSKKLKKILAQQKIPRKLLFQGKGHSSYGWSKDDSKLEYDFYKKQYNFISEESSEGVLNNFQLLVEKYNQNWPSILSDFE